MSQGGGITFDPNLLSSPHDQHDSRSGQLIIIASVFIVLSVSVTLLRCYVRIFISRMFGLDDYLMVFSTLSYIVLCSFLLTCVSFGGGRHYWDIPPEDSINATKYFISSFTAYAVSVTAVKLSIGIFLLRFSLEPIQYWTIYVCILVSVAQGAVYFFVCIFQCSPITFFWDKSQPGSCMEVSTIATIAIVYTITTVIVDVVFATLPIYLVFSLSCLDLKVKVALIPVFCMAFLASAAVVLRYQSLHALNSPDLTYEAVAMIVWTCLEGGLAITAGCLVTFRPLFLPLLRMVGFGRNETSEEDDTIVREYRRRHSEGRIRRPRNPFSLGTLFRDEATDVEMANGSDRGTKEFSTEKSRTVSTFGAQDERGTSGQRSNNGGSIPMS